MRCLLQIGLCFIFSIAYTVSSVTAQTLFSFPDTTPNYANYHHVEECVSIIERSDEEQRRKVFGDTMPWSRYKAKPPYEASAAAEIQRCMQSVHVDTVEVEKWVKNWERYKKQRNYVLAGFLMANREADLQRLSQRIRASLSTDSNRAREFSLARIYASARPPRVEAAREEFERDIRLWSDSLRIVVVSYLRMIELYRTVGDDTTARQLVQRMMGVVDGVPVKNRALVIGGLALGGTTEMLMWATESEGFDSLSRSNAAYRKYLTGILMRTQGDSTWIADSKVGTQAKPFARNFIAQYVSRDHPERSDRNIPPYVKIQKSTWAQRPVPGKINLIVFLENACWGQRLAGRGKLGRNNGFTSSCWQDITGLRHLKEQFPEIELTIVAKTFGSVGITPELQPEVEADTLARLYLGYHQLHGTLIVSETQYFRVPGVDDRRIDIPESLDAMESESGAIFGVDGKGEIFFYGQIQRLGSWDQEKFLGKAIEVISKRDGSRT